MTNVLTGAERFFAAWRQSSAEGNLYSPDDFAEFLSQQTFLGQAVHNVKDPSYGATGDGSTDDAPAIRAAITAAVATFNGIGSPVRVLLPRGNYLLNSTVEVPPGVSLGGVGLFSTNLGGSAILVNFDGVGVRLVRRNAFAGSLFHLGGLRDLAFTGTGASATTAQRLVELGDASDVSTSTGAWNLAIKGCVFNNTYGYGIYSAHSQEAIIRGNWFRGVKFPIRYRTVTASARIRDNTFLDESGIPGARAIELNEGVLGGAGGAQVTGNYFLGYESQVWASTQTGLVVRDNSFEGCYASPIVLEQYLSDGATLDGAGCVGASVDGNLFINWAAAGAAAACIQLHHARYCEIGTNTYESPNAAAGNVLALYDGGAGDCYGNRIRMPVVVGANAGLVAPRPTGNGLVLQQAWLPSGTPNDSFTQHTANAGSPASAGGFGAGDAGAVWWDNTAKKLKGWDGTQIITLTSTP